MRVLLTGASGFLGSYTLKALQRWGVETVTVGRSPANQSTAFIHADLLTVSDFSAIVRESGASHLLHLAWYTEHGKYWTSRLNLRWMDATTRLVEAFCESGGRQVVIAGTCAEYDWSYGYCREDNTPLVPATLYGTAKDAARRLVMAVCSQYGVTCSWGRVFLPFGYGEASPRLIPSLIEVLRGTRPPFGVNACSYRDFLHASDIAEGLIVLLQSGLQGSYNVSSGCPVRLGDVVCELARILHADPHEVLDLTSERVSEPLLLVGENVKLKAMGWLPKLSLEQGLEITVQETLK